MEIYSHKEASGGGSSWGSKRASAFFKGVTLLIGLMSSTDVSRERRVRSAYGEGILRT